MNHVGSATLSGVLDLVEKIPDELLLMENATYASFIQAKAEIRNMLATWNANRTGGHSLGKFPLPSVRDACASAKQG